MLAPSPSWTVGSVLVSLLVHTIGPLAAAYLVDRSARHTGVFVRRRRACWWLGWMSAVLAVSPPVDALAHASFLWHMVQHLVIVLVSAPALVVARPDLVAIRALPHGPRRRLAKAMAAAVPRGWFAPAAALGAFVGWLWLTHMTSIYDRTLVSPLLHGVEHVLYLVTAMAFWVPFVLVHSRSELRRIVAPLALTFVAMPATSTLALVLLNAAQPRYAAYSLADQRAGAAAMWVGMGAAMLAAVLLAVGRAIPERRDVVPGASHPPAGPSPDIGVTPSQAISRARPGSWSAQRSRAGAPGSPGSRRRTGR